MKRLLFLTVLWAVTGFLLPAGAQINCATDQVTELMRRTDPRFFGKEELHQDRIQQFRSNYPNFPILPTTPPPTGKKGATEMGGSSELTSGSTCRKAQFIIPVVVHIFHSSTESTPGTGTNISDAQVADAIEALNKAFANQLGSTNPVTANTGIQFCLAQVKPDSSSFNGIIRIQNDTLTNCYVDLARWDAQINRSHYQEDRYLNIYIVNNILDTFGVNHGILGFATYPFPGYKHGIVMRADQFGNALTCGSCNLNGNARGIVLVHEMGHFLGLKHTFEGGCIGLTSVDCATKGDLCCDTPPIAVESSTCGIINSCTLDVPDRNDQVENFMDYTGQTCQTMFTRDQLSIMRSTLYGYYTEFWKPKNVNALNLSCCINSALVSTGRNFLCQGEATTMYAYQYSDTANYRWRIERNGSLIFTTNTSADSLVRTFNDTGRFDIILTVRSGTDSIADTLRNYIEVRTCGPTLASTQGNWYFGDVAGLRFTPGGPIRDLGPYNNRPNTNSDEGTAVISNTNGQLLYYAGGDAGEDGISYHIYDRKYEEINGSPVTGDGSSTQGAIFLPYPNDTNRIYLLTVAYTNPASRGFYYHIINRTTNSVEISNQRITFPMIWAEDLQVAEAICAIPTCEDSTYWVYVLSARMDSILTYRVGSTISYVRGTYTPDLLSHTGTFAIIKASPDAKWLTVHDLLYRVNRSTGELTLHLQMQKPWEFYPPLYGISFSPDSRYLYRLEPLSQSFTWDAESYLYQMDLYSSNDSLSKFRVSRVPRFFEQLQLAPDGKIYISSGGNTYLGVINQPNVRSTVSNPNACGYQQVGPMLSSAGVGGTSKTGLPNLVNAKFNEDIPLDFFHIDTLCRTVSFVPTNDCFGSYKWDFGDGGVSTSREVLHTYDNSGTYVVRLVAGSDTVTKLLTFGIPAPAVATDSIYCDTTTSHFITISNREDRYQYSFTATTGVITVVPSSTEVRIVWKADGNLTVTAYDPATGCSNSAVIHAKKKTLTNTITAPNTIVCPSDTTFTLTGNQPDTVGAAIAFQWYSSVDNINFFPINGATGKNYKPNAGAFWAPDTFFRRLARYENGCQSFSNTLGISRSVIGNVINPSNACTKGSAVNLTGISAGAHYLTWGYQWQKSYDSLTWTDVVGATGVSLSTTLDSEIVYYRRLVVAPGQCEAPSNTIKVVASLRITVQPQNTTVCGLGAPYFMNVGVDNTSGLSLTYTWEIKESGSLSWSFLGSGNPLFNTTGKSFTDGDTIRCTVHSSCGDIYSAYAILYINNLSVSILNTLPDVSTTEGSSLNLSLLTSPTTGVTYNWQVSYDGGSTWTTIQQGENNALSISSLRTCDAGLYRAVVSNICGTVFSNTSTVTVTPTHAWDIAMKDAWTDNGTEGLTSVSYSIYNSPDLWVRYKRDGVARHQNPVRDYYPGQPNYVYARIRNLSSTTATPPSELYLYWTKASTEERWPFDWTASFGNQAVNWVNGQLYPLGGEVNTVPIAIPALAPNDSVIVSYPWTPPSPAWYSFFVNGQPRVETQSHICLLSRLVTCPNPIYGIAYQEVEEVRQNIMKNNNIATRNMSVSRIDVSQPKQQSGVVKVMNTGLTLDTSKLVIKVGNPTIFSYAQVIVHLDDDLNTYWTNGGSQKSGLTLLGPNRLELTASNAEISNLFIPSQGKGYFYVEFQLKPGVTVLPENLYEMEVQQWNGPFDADQKGSVHFQLAIGSTNLTAKKENALTVTENKSASWVNVYPNPFSGQTMIVFDLDKSEQVSIDLYDVTGKLVQTIPGKRYEAGQHQEIINAAGLADGIYYCRIKAGSKLVNEKLVLLKAQ